MATVSIAITLHQLSEEIKRFQEYKRVGVGSRWII
jgi:hypothetical protein